MEESRVWLEKAGEDLDTANFNMENQRYSYAAFLYQQAVEKALKFAVLEKNKKLPKIHDCYVLAKEAGAPDELTEKCDAITPYYFRTRYPDVGEEVTKEEVKELKRTAEEVLEWTKKNF